MVISELIAGLELIKDRYGDITCVISQDKCGTLIFKAPCVDMYRYTPAMADMSVVDGDFDIEIGERIVWL